MARADVAIDFSAAGAVNSFETGHTIQIPSTLVQYRVYIDSLNDVAFRKSTNDGLTWGAKTVIFAGTAVSVSVWYDKDSGLAGGLIHCAYIESATDDTLYRTIDTASADALSTQTVIFAGASTATGGSLSITRAVGGNVYCAVMIDAGAEGGFFRPPNANVPNGAWDAARADVFEAVTLDQVLLAPGFAADNQDIIAFFGDQSASEWSRKVYDDSANSWAETSIATSMTINAASNSQPHASIVVDLTNSQVLFVAWSNIDTLNADLRCWKIAEGFITEVTNVVLNSTDDQGLCGIALATDTGNWHVVYCGKSDGSETFNSAVNVYTKVSTDGGTTWGAETLISSQVYEIECLCCNSRFAGNLVVNWQAGGSDIALIFASAELPAAGGGAHFSSFMSG